MRRLRVLLIAWVAAMLLAPAALACVCRTPDANGQPLDADAEIRRIDVAGMAEVKEIRVYERCFAELNGPVRCRTGSNPVVVILEPFKGSITAPIEVYEMAGTSCDAGLKPGQRLFFTAYYEREALGDTHFRTSLCGITINARESLRPAFERYRATWSGLQARALEAPNDLERWRALGAFLEKWGDHWGALAAYSHTAELAPDDAVVIAAKGRVQFYLHQPAAIDTLKRAIALQPDDHKARSMLALLQAHFGAAEATTSLDLGGLDLRGFHFTGLNMQASDFRDADLSGAAFDNVDLAHADFRGATLQDVYMRQVSLEGADLGGTDFRFGVRDMRTFSHARLAGLTVNLGRLMLDTPGASIADSDLAGAHVVCSDYRKPWWSDMPEADLKRAWTTYLDELRLAARIKSEQPSALLDPSCTAAIADHLHENCAPWIPRAERPAECVIADKP